MVLIFVTGILIDSSNPICRSFKPLLKRAVAGGEPLVEEATLRKLDLLRAEVAGPEPTPLEVLLTERICSLWLLIEALEMLVSVQLSANLSRAPLLGYSVNRGNGSTLALLLKAQASALLLCFSLSYSSSCERGSGRIE